MIFRGFLMAGTAAAVLTFPAQVLAQTGSNTSAQARETSSSPQSNASQQQQTRPAVADGDIIVTANRTESLASKTPVALTAISGDGLRNAGVTNPTELKDYVPNLSIDRASGGLQLTIRGVTSTDTTEKGDPSAAFLVDGVYIARPQAQETSFFDIARVEVLRGPQGTLYGRNTTAGVVNAITVAPSMKLGGSGDFEVGNYGAYRGTAIVNVPVNEAMALRASVNYDRRDNYLDAGPRLTGKLNPFKENLSARLQGLVKWDTGSLLVRGDYSDIRGTPYDLVNVNNFYAPTTTGVNPTYVGGSGGKFRRENAPVTWDTFRKNYTWGAGAEINQDIGPVRMTYLGSYRRFKRNESDARIATNDADAYYLTFHGTYWQNSQELRFATNGTGPLKLQAGAYYFHEESAIQQKVVTAPDTTDGTTSLSQQDPTISTSYAFFGQGTYSITNRLRLTGGVRYSHDDKSRYGINQNCTSFSCTSGAITPNAAAVTYSKVTWKGGVDFDLAPTTLLYGVVSSGYKAGGFNNGCLLGSGVGCTFAASALYYNPETLVAYEAGIKTRQLNNALRLNLSVFHYDYSNIQLTQVANECFGPGSAPCQVTLNGGKAKVSGVEVEGSFAASPVDRFDFSGSYLDAHYSDYRPNPTTNLSGRSLDRSPRWTFTGGYAHTFPLANGGEIIAGVHTKYSDSYTFLILGSLNFYGQPSFTKTDVTVTYNAPGKRWYAQAFAKNLEDANVVTTVAVAAPRGSVQLADPRTYGMRVGFHF